MGAWEAGGAGPGSEMRRAFNLREPPARPEKIAARQIPSAFLPVRRSPLPRQAAQLHPYGRTKGGRHMVQRSQVRRDPEAGTGSLVAPEGPLVTPGFHPLADFASFGPNEVGMLLQRSPR